MTEEKLTELISKLEIVNSKMRKIEEAVKIDLPSEVVNYFRESYDLIKEVREKLYEEEVINEIEGYTE